MNNDASIKRNVVNLDSARKRFAIKLMKPFANNFILLNPKNKVKKNRVNVNYWSGSPNLGDAISPIIVEHLLEKKGLSLTDEVSKTSHLYAVGSVITAGLQDCTIWGSGILYTLLGYRLRNRLLDIRAVRGPLTRVVLLEYGYDVPEIYGDPAMFLPEIYSPNRTEKKYKYGVVAHKNGASRLKNVHDILSDNYLDIDIKTNDYKVFVDQLLSVERVISTSLHGIILAESYGIPAILVRPDYSLFKYYDYYLGTNRGSFPILEKLPSKEELDKMYFPELPDTEIIRQRLEEAFPYDLFH